jgi:predicted GTPase
VIATDTRQAAKRTAQVREEIETSLRQFREKLEDVESIVAVYTNEDEIIAAALDVIVSILQAIEDIVDYYWANKGKS